MHREEAGGKPVATKSWPRSSSWPPRAAPGGNSHQRFVRAGRRSTDGSPSGGGPASGQRSTASSSTYSAPAANSTGRGARSPPSDFGLRKRQSTGPNPNDRGKPESKAHLTTDRKGISLAPGASDADMHDSQGHQPLVRGISLTSPCRVRRRAVGGRPPLHRAAVSALKCTSGQPRNAFAPGGNRRDFCTEPGEPTCRKPGEVSQESPLSGEGGVSRATQPSCSFSHRRTSGVTGSVMSANSSCRLRNLAT